MTSTTTHSPIQDIKAAEADAARRVEAAKKLAVEEGESFKVQEDNRLEEKKSSLKEEATKKLKKEKESLGNILKEGKGETGNQVKALKDTCTKNQDAIVQKLIDQFLTQT